MEAHISQCAMDLKAWVSAMVGEQHIEDCENQVLLLDVSPRC